eukprot:44098_1
MYTSCRRTRICVVLLFTIHIIHCHAKGKWARAYPASPFGDYCFPTYVKRWGFHPNWAAEAHKSAQSKLLQYPTEGWMGEPLQAQGIPIQAHMEWDSVTGEPSIENAQRAQCQEDDQPPAPPWACIMVINSETADVMPCSGKESAIILQGPKTAIPLVKSSDVPAGVLALFNQIHHAASFPNGYADIIHRNDGSPQLKQAQGFCCSENIVPTLHGNTWTEEWEYPYLKIFMEGNFTVKVTNTDILNTFLSFDQAWGQTTAPIRINKKVITTRAPVSGPTEPLSQVYGTTIRCPIDAQMGGDITAEDCVEWNIDNNGKKVTYISEYPFSLAKQRKTYFKEDTEMIVLTNAQMSAISVGLFDNLEMLRSIDLSHNIFKDIPSLGLGSAFIEALDISYNELETLNIYTFRDMIKLTVLKANNNKIRYLEPNIFEMMLLQQLYLNNNSLSVLPQGLFTTIPTSMLYLEVLDLRHNNLQMLSDRDFFNYSANLEQFLLDGNPLKDISPFLNQLPSYEILIDDKSGSTEAKPKQIPIQVKPQSKIKKFTVDFSLATSITNELFVNMISLEHLEMKVSITVASQLTYDLFVPMGGTLQELHLWTEDAFRIPNNFLHPCQALETIEWTRSGLLSIKNRFVGLQNLKHLDLSGNIIFTLSAGVFDDLKNLAYLDVSENNIEYIHPNAFKYTDKLKHVLMSMNQLKTLSKAVFTKLHDPENPDIPVSQRRIIRELNLVNNPISCVPIWMEGPESNWASSILKYTSLYGPPPGYCTLCGVGYYSARFDNEGNDCEPCPEGALCPYDHDEDKGTFPWTLIWCEPGTYVERGKGMTLDDCEACPAGHYCPGEGEIYPCTQVGEVCEGGCIDTCYTCPSGTFASHDHTKCHSCDRGYYSNDGLKCHMCPAGTYGDMEGLTNASCSGLCAIGHYCLEGSTVSTQHKCPAATYGNTEGLTNKWCSGLCEIGSYCPEGSVSRYGVQCPAGRYGSKPGLGEPECSGPCSPEHWCPVGSVSPINIKCSNGNISRAGDPNCYQCAPDHYNNKNRWPTCTNCAGSRTFNSSVSGVVINDIDQCESCPLGTYNLTINPYSIYEVSECRECPPGTYNNKWFSDTKDDCKPCPVNTYSDIPGISSPYLCNKCPLGTFSNVTGAVSMKVCIPCPAGKYFLEGIDAELSRDIDVVCKYCPSGSWTDGSDGICHLCEVGYWSNIEGRTSPCIEICDKGYLCPAGSTDPRMFILPQGHDLPILAYPFWIGTLFCFCVSSTVLLFKLA